MHLPLRWLYGQVVLQLEAQRLCHTLYTNQVHNDCSSFLTLVANSKRFKIETLCKQITFLMRLQHPSL